MEEDTKTDCDIILEGAIKKSNGGFRNKYQHKYFILRRNGNLQCFKMNKGPAGLERSPFSKD